MSTLNKLKLYTQPRCVYCVMLKEKLDDGGFNYVEINIKEDEAGAEFIKSNGHSTVPQLYYNNTRINGENTSDLTIPIIESKMKELEWTSVDSGIEQQL